MGVRDLLAALSTRLRQGAAAFVNSLRTTTPGQYWTSALALLVALPVLLFGLPPTATIVEAAPDPAPRSTTPPVALPPTDAPTDVGILAGPPPPARGGAPKPFVPSGTPGLGSGPGAGGGGGEEPPPRSGPVVRPTIIFLADASPAAPGRSDAEIAVAMATNVPFQYSVVTADLDDEATCQQVEAQGALIITSRGLGPALRACLLEAGANLIGHDDGGSVVGERGPIALSTAHGASRALLDLASVHDGSGTIGLVGTEELRPPLEDAIARAAADGWTVARTAWVRTDASDDTALQDAVVDFAGAGVDTVVFAVPADIQRRWLLRSSLLLANATLLVLDVADAIHEDLHLPTFQGATAPAVTRVSVSGTLTDDQADCREQWQSTGATTLSNAELARVLLWCQHLELASSAIRAIISGTTLRDALAELSTASVVSTPVGPRDGDWGPTAIHSLGWSAACSCWQPQ